MGSYSFKIRILREHSLIHSNWNLLPSFPFYWICFLTFPFKIFIGSHFKLKKKLQIEDREFLCILHLASPNVNNSYNNCIIIETRTTAISIIIKLIQTALVLSLKSFFKFQDLIPYLIVSINLWQFFILFLSLMTFTLLINPSQLFWRTSLILGLFHISSRLDWESVFLSWILQRWSCIFLCVSFQGTYNMDMSSNW